MNDMHVFQEKLYFFQNCHHIRIDSFICCIPATLPSKGYKF
jgi:hypothetical protein